jgi:hypothetical protein
MVMLFDCLLAWLSLQPGYGGLVVDGLILGKASLVVLGLYLFWNRNETAKAGKVEIRRGDYGRRRQGRDAVKEERIDEHV